MQRRGRSRQVSNTALARQASEERRSRSFYLSTSPSPSRSPSPLSPKDDESSDNLRDQLHYAYSVDNIHLAKIILLRLRGISITSSDDPRIAAVQPEDFDECFIPGGGLMSDKEDWARVEEMQAREQEKQEEARRIWKQREQAGTWESNTARKWRRKSGVAFPAVLAAMRGALFPDEEACPGSPDSDWSLATLAEEEAAVLPRTKTCQRRAQCQRLCPIPLNQSPLYSPEPLVSISEPHIPVVSRPYQAINIAAGLVGRVSRFVQLARNFQNAYVAAIVHSAEPAPAPHHYQPRNRFEARPVGCRAQNDDILRFISVIESDPEEDDAVYIQLASPFPLSYPPRTILPCPLPYPITFKPQIPPHPSPLKRFAQLARAHMVDPVPSQPRYAASRYRARAPSPTSSPIVRLRCIPNPVHLRLKALHNIVSERGVDWEGRYRDGMMGCGKEKLVGVAFDEMGKSSLRRPLKPPQNHRYSSSHTYVLLIQ
jgi:hypothetical protein